jgi:hypothetical protein
MALAAGGVVCSVAKLEPLYLGGFGLAMIVILLIVGTAENDRNHSS